MEEGFIDAGGGYALSLTDAKVVCKNAKGALLKSVPKKVRESEAARQLAALRDWIERHERECGAEVESWMLRSLSVPRAVIAAVFDDPAWRTPLLHAVVCPLDGDEVDLSQAGFLEDASAERGVGLVDLDGESRWLDAREVVVPHPILLADGLEPWRELASDLGFVQGLPQLMRETFVRTSGQRDSSVRDFAGGTFEQLNHARARCRTLGFRVRGGFAVCPVFEGGASVEARFLIDGDYPEGEAVTGELVWVDEREHLLPLGALGPVAFSEGMRMASAIYAGRRTEGAAS